MAKNKLLPNGFICGDSSSNSEDNTLKKDLFAYISSGGRNVESSSSGGAEEKDNEEKKSESKDNDNNNDDDGKQDETNSQIQESFVPPDWVNIADDVEWLTKVMDAIDPLEDLSVGFDSMDIYGSNQSNAFAITMFCLDGMFESRACDFLPHAFKAFPDLEYCLLTVPSTVLLESRLVRGYTPALPKAGTSYSHSLFILHRDTVLASTYLSVQRLFPSSLNNGSDERRDEIDTMMIQQKKEQEEDEANGAVGKDLELIKSINEKNIQGYKLGVAVEKLLKSNLSPKKAQEVRDLLTVVGDEDKSAVSENPPRAAFVATIGTTGAVGIIILDRSSLSADRINFYKANFDLENYLVMDRFRTKAQALITALIVDPVFHHQTRFILKEAMRLFEKTLIYYQNDPSSSPDSWAYHPPRLVYQHFLPATPRIRPQPQPLEPQPFNIIAANSKVTNKADIQIAYEKQDHTMPAKGFALQFLSRAMLSEPRLSVQARIVIIGATATTAAFLQRFLLNPTMFYSNVTLISPTGFPRPKPSSTASSVQVVNEDMFDETKMASLTLESRCRLLLASVTSIDRENKTLTLCRTDQTTTNYFADGSGGDILPYDYLIVTDELVDSTKFDLADGSRELMAQPDAWNPHIEDGTAVGMNNEIVSPVFSLTHPDVDSFVDKAIEESNGGGTLSCSIISLFVTSS
jgi:hypothetical protein